VLSLTRLLGAPVGEDPDLRYHPSARATRTGAVAGRGPVVVWNWTRRCNLACRHCYASAVRGPAPGELDTAEAHALLRQLAALRVPALLLSGGEPLVRPDALDLLTAASGLSLRCTLSTNGTLIDADTARGLAAAGITYVGISVDGPPADHDRWRGRRGAHAATLAGIRRLRAEGVRVGLRFTLHRASVPHLPYLFELAAAEGISRICVYHLVPAGRGADLGDLGLTAAETRRALDYLLEQARWHVEQGSGMEVLTVGNHSDGPYAIQWMRSHLPGRVAAARTLLQRNGGNRSGVALLAIDPVGEVHPDQFSWDQPLGNVRQTPLQAIWQGEAVPPLLTALRSARRERIQGRCARCAWFDLCNGNLRARAAAAGDFWGSDPACVLADDDLTDATASA
jgi:radical SAM protein with 4Fe4S-binding SPASM domain